MYKIKYISVNDLSNTIRLNLYKIPKYIDLIVGIPRSGMFCSLLLGMQLNKPVISLEDFLENKSPEGGGRMKYIKTNNFKNILVLDDNVCSGRAMQEVKNKINKFKYKENYNFKFGCIYAEGINSTDKVDIFLEYIRIPEVNLYLYEWNILHFDANYTEHFMYDIDGIICKDPPDDKINIEEYEKYIKNPITMIIPSRKIGAFVTYRLNKYREITENWLKSLNIQYHTLYMVNANSWEERANLVSPSVFKAYIYKNANWALLFIESNKNQAIEINKLSGKPVYCYEDGKLYQ